MNVLRKTLGRALCGAFFFSPLASQTLTPELLTRGVFESREYRSENGRRIRITSMGNLTALESPYGFEHIDTGRRSREGYVLSYTDPATGQVRVLHDVHDSYSRILGGRDFMPTSFSGPPTGSTFPVNTLITATANVDTRDGYIRLIHRFEWRAGRGTVAIRTTVVNRLTGREIVLRSFKRHADIDLDGGGAYGAAITNDWLRADDGVNIYIRCNCAPPIPPSPLTPPAVSMHTLSFTGAPAPPYKMIKSISDDSELLSAAPAPGSDLAGPRRSENNQATLAWGSSALAPGGSQLFTVQYQVE